MATCSNKIIIRKFSLDIRRSTFKNYLMRISVEAELPGGLTHTGGYGSAKWLVLQHLAPSVGKADLHPKVVFLMCNWIGEASCTSSCFSAVKRSMPGRTELSWKNWSTQWRRRDQKWSRTMRMANQTKFEVHWLDIYAISTLLSRHWIVVLPPVPISTGSSLIQWTLLKRSFLHRSRMTSTNAALSFLKVVF